MQKLRMVFVPVDIAAPEESDGQDLSRADERGHFNRVKGKAVLEARQWFTSPVTQSGESAGRTSSPRMA